MSMLESVENTERAYTLWIKSEQSQAEFRRRAPSEGRISLTNTVGLNSIRYADDFACHFPSTSRK